MKSRLGRSLTIPAWASWVLLLLVSLGRAEMSVIVKGTDKSFKYNGASGSLSYTVRGGTPKTTISIPVSTDAPSWIYILQNRDVRLNAKGEGKGSVKYRVDAYEKSAPSPRAGILHIADQVFQVSQTGAPCTVKLQPTAAKFPAEGDNGLFAVHAPEGCGWSAKVDSRAEDWIRLEGDTDGPGEGSIAYRVDPNGAKRSRTGRISVIYGAKSSQKTHSIKQQAGSGSGAAIDQNTAGYNELGSGYDLFTVYADSEFTRNQIFNLDTLNKDTRLYKFAVDKFDVTERSGTTINEYEKSYSASLGISGSYGLFSAQVNSIFATQTNITTEWSFSTIQINHLVHGLRIQKMSSEELRGYLLPIARQDIDTLPPRQLFSMYGTHAIGKLVVGGRLDYNLSAHITNKERKTDIGVYAKAKLKSGINSVGITTSFNAGEFEDNYVSENYEKLSAVGGQGSAVQIWSDAEYNKWVTTVWENPVFCHFSADPWLIPLWELADGWSSGTCGPGTRCETIRGEYERYAAEHSYNIAQMPIHSPFENTTEGWTAPGAANLNWHNVTNPSPYFGHLEATDGSSSPWWFQANTDYSGDMRNFYGGELSYWLRWRGSPISSCAFRGKHTNYYQTLWRPDVELSGGNGVSIGYFFPDPGASIPPPGANVDVSYFGAPDYYNIRLKYHDIWRRYALPITEYYGRDGPYAYGWVRNCYFSPCYTAATREEILEVLQDVRSMRIRGEYCFGVDGASNADRGMLDEVRLMAPNP